MAHLNDPTAVSEINLTRKNVCNEQAAKDAESDLRRCVTEADFAAWSRNWGEAFVTYRLRRDYFQ